MRTLIQDFRFGLRLLARNPAVAAAAILTLALGIGACTTIVCVVDAVLLRPLPYTAPERLVLLFEVHADQAPGWRGASFPAFNDWREWIPELEGLAATRRWRPVLDHGDELESLEGAKVSAGFFSLLGIEPSIGRAFSAQDDQPGAAAVVMLSHGLWQRRFGGAADLIGRRIALEGSGERHRATVIGILPPTARIGEPLLFDAAEIWTPMALDPLATHRGRRYFRVVGRLAATAGLAGACGRLRAVTRSLARRYPDTNAGWGASMEPLGELLVAPVRPALLALLAAAGCVFLVACTNVAILLSTQATTRYRELAVRRALGAGPLHVGRQLVSESLMIVGAGTALGLLLAAQGSVLIARHAFGSLPRSQDVAVDLRVILFTLALALSIAVVFGLMLAVRAASTNITAALRQAGPGARRSGHRGARLRHFLVLAEIALSLVLLLSATLMMRSFERLTSADPGFEPRGVLTLRLQLPRSVVPEAARADALFQGLLRQVEGLPGVREAGLVSLLPMQGGSMSTRAVARPTTGEPIQVEFCGISDGYFRSIGIPVLRGRDLSPRDGGASTGDAILLSEDAAQRLWPGEEALGKRLVLDWGAPTPRRVVGIVGDVRHHGVRADVKPTVYLHYSSVPHRSMTLVARTDARHRATLAADLRARAVAFDRAFVVEAVRPLSQIVDRTTIGSRNQALLLGAFAVVSVLLAASGVYSVVAYDMAQRRCDLGVRLALGAHPLQLVRVTVAEGLRLASWGLGAGLAASLLAARLLEGLLYGVSSHDPWTLLSATALMLGVVLFACYVPARRATKMDPAAALRGSGG